MSYRLAVNVFFLINGFVYANWAARIPAMEFLYSLSKSEIGVILLTHSIGAFIAMPLTGYLISRFTSRKVTICSGLLFPFFFLLIPYMRGFSTLLIPFFLMGASTGIMDVAMNAQAVDVEKKLNKPVMTMFHALFSIGMVLGGLVGTFVINAEVTMMQHFPWIFASAIISLALASIYLYPDKPIAEENEPWLIMPKGPIIWLGIIAFCCMMGEGAIADWSAIYMKEVVVSEPYLYAMGLTAFAALMTTGRLFGDRGRQYFGDMKMLVYGSILAVAGIGLVLMYAQAYLVIMGFAVVGLGLSNIVPIVYSLAGNMKGIKPGVGIAMSTTIGYCGFMVGPPIIGFIADFSSLFYSFVLLSVLFVVMCILINNLNLSHKN